MTVTVTISNAGQVMNPSYEVVSIDVVKEMNRIPYAQIVLLDGSAAKQKFVISDTTFFEPGQEIEIKLRYEDDAGTEASVFEGLVVRHAVEATERGFLLIVELKDAAIKLTHTRKSQIYVDKRDDEIIASLIAGGGLKKGTLATTATKHAEIVQYYCTDWDFMLSRAEACGLMVAAEDGQISLNKIEVNNAPKHTFEFGIDEIYNFEIEVDASSQYAQVESVAWDLKKQKLTQASKAKTFDLSQGNLNTETIAKTLGAASQVLSSPVPVDPKALQAWADGSMAKSRMAMIRGRIAMAGNGKIKRLEVMKIAGVGKRFNGKTLITGVRHRVDTEGWQTDVQFGLSPERFAAQKDIVDVPAAGLLPAVNGLQIGIVDKFKEDPDKEFRVSVILPGLGEKAGTLWARLASPDAGREHGYFFRPEPGDEVVVGFFNDDPGQAVILGAMYGSTNKPPASLSNLTEKNIDKGIVTKTGTSIRFIDDKKSAVSIETPEKNKIVLDDDKKTIVLSDQSGNTITMSEDGIEIKSAKDFKLSASGNVEIKGTKVDVK